MKVTFLVLQLAHFITRVALHWVSVRTNTNVTYDYLTSRDAGVENDMSLQLDTRDNKMLDKEPGVPNNADNDKVNKCLSPLNVNGLIPTCLFSNQAVFLSNMFESTILSSCAIIQMAGTFRASRNPASTSVLLPCRESQSLCLRSHHLGHELFLGKADAALNPA